MHVNAINTKDVKQLLRLYVAAVNTRHRKDARRIFNRMWKEA